MHAPAALAMIPAYSSPPPPQVSIATMGIGVGTLWAGLFGMNVRTLQKPGHASEMSGY